MVNNTQENSEHDVDDGDTVLPVPDPTNEPEPELEPAPLPLVIRAVFDELGFPKGFYPSEFWPEGYPETAVEITRQQYDELLSNQGVRCFIDGEVVECVPPPIDAPDPVTIVNNVDLWSRMTDDEADQVGVAMEQQSFRTRKIFESASTFRSDHELWPLLEQIATTLFGAERAAEILAPSL